MREMRGRWIANEKSGTVLDHGLDLVNGLRVWNLNNLENGIEGTILKEIDDNLPKLFLLQAIRFDVLVMKRGEHRKLEDDILDESRGERVVFVVEGADRLNFECLGRNTSLLKDRMNRIGLKLCIPIRPKLFGCQQLFFLDHRFVEL